MKLGSPHRRGRQTTSAQSRDREKHCGLDESRAACKVNDQHDQQNQYEGTNADIHEPTFPVARSGETTRREHVARLARRLDREHD